MFACAHICAHVWKAETNLGYLPLGVFLLVYRDRVSYCDLGLPIGLDWLAGKP